MRKTRLLTRTAQPKSGVGITFAFALVLGLTPAPGSDVLAGPVQFASFTTASGAAFSFTNNGSSVSPGSDAISSNYSFTSVNSLATVNSTETLSLNGITPIPVYTTVSIFDQPNNGPSTDPIVFNDLITNQAMLTMSFMRDMTAQFGDANGSLGWSAGATILSYSSPLLPSYLSLPVNFQLTPSTEAKTTVAASSSYKNSFTSASPSGQFFTNPSSIVPAPASAVMIATGLSVVAVLALWKTRTRQRKLALIPISVSE
jgi:hypothetical protein